MRRESRQLKQKAIDSLINAVEFFNRPRDEGRVVAVLFFLQHAFEMLLKAAINEIRGTVFPPGGNRSHGFQKCCAICRSDIGLIDEADVRVLDLINNLRDQATHFIVDPSEAALYAYSQSGMSLFERVLSDCFGEHLIDHLPGRVLPLSTIPPRDIQLIVEEEVEEILELVAPGRRQGHIARPRLRHLIIVDATLRGEEVDPTDASVDQKIAQLREAEDWRTILPGAAVLTADPNAGGPALRIRLGREGDIAARKLRPGEDPESALVYRELRTEDTWPFSRDDIAEKLGLTGPKTTALIRYLKIQEDPELFTVAQFGASRHPCYSPKALERLRAALREVDMNEVWAQHRPRQRARPSRSD